MLGVQPKAVIYLLVWPLKLGLLVWIDDKNLEMKMVINSGIRIAKPNPMIKTLK